MTKFYEISDICGLEMRIFARKLVQEGGIIGLFFQTYAAPPQIFSPTSRNTENTIYSISNRWKGSEPEQFLIPGYAYIKTAKISNYPITW